MRRIVALAFMIVIGSALPAEWAIAAPGRTATSRPSSRTKSKPPTESPPPNPWPTLNDQQQAEAIEQLKKFAEETANKLNHPLRMLETRYFLFVSDLSPQEANNWAGLLDRMYVRLAGMFAVPKAENIWRGKALIFVFSNADDYRHYERTMVHTDPGTSAGMCHSYSDGTVKIAFYRQKNELTFAHVLVHESVHGFIHRYRSPTYIPSWANEGLAETIATDLVPERGRRSTVMSRARENLQGHQNSMGDFFTTPHIDDWQYPVAETLCTFMIQASSRNYVAFIKGIKDGLTWDEALEKKYQAPVDRLVPVYGQWIGVRNLTANPPR